MELIAIDKVTIRQVISELKAGEVEKAIAILEPFVREQEKGVENGEEKV